MEIKLLANGYKNNEQLFIDFINDYIDLNNDYFSNKIVFIKDIPEFPIYMGRGSEEEIRKDFLEAFRVISESYLHLDRDIIMNETFWHSLLVTEKRNYILQKYPQVRNSLKDFKNIVLKKFDWENYIYKCIIATQYINDNVSDKEERQRYYELVIDNLDVFNYIIKYSIFRNDKFLLNILDIIDELGISELVKAKIKGREDLGDDERYGRRVIFELNKSYPVVTAPMLDKEELKKYFIIYLNYYYDVTQIIPGKELPLEVVEKNSNGLVESISTEEHVNIDIFGDQEIAATKGNSKDDVGSSIIVADTKSTTYAVENRDVLIEYLNDNNLEYIDERDNNGHLWVIGKKDLKEYFNILEEKFGVKFKYKSFGSKSTKFRSTWFWYDR